MEHEPSMTMQPSKSMSHAITVGIRMRPMLGHEAGQQPCFELMEPNDISVLTGASGVTQPKGFEGPWRFDHAMDSSVPKGSTALFTDNDACYERMGKPMLQQSLEGYNVCLFCYGQTGTGKTTTVMGDPEHGEGVLVKLLRDLFVEMEKFRAEGATCDVSVQMLEVYNETVHDLLQPNREEMLKTKVNVHLLPRGVSVQGAVSKAVENVDECMKLIDHANKLKTMFPTAMNPQSSRGHVIFKLFLHKSGGPDGLLLDSEIYFADLAGHENEKTTHVTGDRFKELTYINKSLMWLQNAIHGLAKPHKDHADMGMFRNSKLTLILSPALTGNSRTAIIVTLSPAAAYFETSIASLKFAVESKHIKVDAKAHKSADPYVHIKELEEEVRQLKAEIKEMKEMQGLAPPPAASPGAVAATGSQALASMSPRGGGQTQFVPAAAAPLSVQLAEEAPASKQTNSQEAAAAAAKQPAAAAKAGKQPASGTSSATTGGPRSPRGGAAAGSTAAAQAKSKAGAKKSPAPAPTPGSARVPAGSTARSGAAKKAPGPAGQSSSPGGKAAAKKPNATPAAAEAREAPVAEVEVAIDKLTPEATNAASAAAAAPAAEAAGDAPEVTGTLTMTSPDESFEWPSQIGADSSMETEAPPDSHKRIAALLEEVRREVDRALGQAGPGGSQLDNLSFDTPLTEKRGQTSSQGREGSDAMDRRMQDLQMTMHGLEEKLRMLSMPREVPIMPPHAVAGKFGGQVGGSTGIKRDSWQQRVPQDGSVSFQPARQDGGSILSAHSSFQPVLHLDGSAGWRQPVGTAAAGQKAEGVRLGSPNQQWRSTSVDAARREPVSQCVRPGPGAAYFPQQHPTGMLAGQQQQSLWAAANQRGRFQVAAVPQTLTTCSWSREGTPRGDRAPAAVAAASLQPPQYQHGYHAGTTLDSTHSHYVVRRLSPMSRGETEVAHQPSYQPYYSHLPTPQYPHPAGAVVVTAPGGSRNRQRSVVRASTGPAAERASAESSPAVSCRYPHILVTGDV